MKRFLFTALALAPSLLFAQQEGVYKINGVLNDVAAKHVYMTYSTGEVNHFPINDTAEVVNHTYTFSRPLNRDICTFAMLKTDDQDQGLALIVLTPETFTVTHNHTFSSPVITGSKMNADFKEMNGTVMAYGKKIRETTDEAEKQKLNVRMKEVYGDYVRKNPSSPLAMYALKAYAVEGHGIDVKKAEPLFKLLPAAIQNAEEGQNIAKQIEYTKVFTGKSKIGVQAQDFMLLDTANRPVKLSSYKGKYVLLDFWASWCAPCRADNPHLKAAYAKYHQQGFDILSVSLDMEPAKAKWLKAIEHDQIGAWTHVADLKNKINAVVALYGIQGIPQNFLIDPSGKIIAMSLRGGTLEEELSRIYKN